MHIRLNNIQLPVYLFAICCHFPSDLQVGQFKHLLGVKPTPQQDLKDVPIISHPKTLKLPDHFDARAAWPHCSTIGKILGWLRAGS